MKDMTVIVINIRINGKEEHIKMKQEYIHKQKINDRKKG